MDDMKIPPFDCYLVHLIDPQGNVESNIYAFAPSISWILNFFKGALLPGYAVIVEDANNATFDSRLWKEDKS